MLGQLSSCGTFWLAFVRVSPSTRNPLAALRRAEDSQITSERTERRAWSFS